MFVDGVEDLLEQAIEVRRIDEQRCCLEKRLCLACRGAQPGLEARARDGRGGLVGKYLELLDRKSVV